MTLVTARLVREWLDYDPDSGLVTWRKQRSNIKSGALAGSNHARGYKQISFFGNVFLLHRVIWLWVTGSWPNSDIDHKNWDRSDNRWRNLRTCNRSLNLHNSVVGKGPKKSGLKQGVFRAPDGCLKKFRAQISIADKRVHLGVFDSEDEAHQAYLNAKRKYAGEFFPEGLNT